MIDDITTAAPPDALRTHCTPIFSILYSRSSRIPILNLSTSILLPLHRQRHRPARERFYGSLLWLLIYLSVVFLQRNGLYELDSRLSIAPTDYQTKESLFWISRFLDFSFSGFLTFASSVGQSEIFHIATWDGSNPAKCDTVFRTPFLFLLHFGYHQVYLSCLRAIGRLRGFTKMTSCTWPAPIRSSSLSGISILSQNVDVPESVRDLGVVSNRLLCHAKGSTVKIITKSTYKPINYNN